MSRTPCAFGPVKPARPRSEHHRDKGMTMKTRILGRLAALTAVAVLAGAPMASVAFAQEAAPAAAEAPAATPAPAPAPAEAAPAPAAAAPTTIEQTMDKG